MVREPVTRRALLCAGATTATAATAGCVDAITDPPRHPFLRGRDTTVTMTVEESPHIASTGTEVGASLFFSPNVYVTVDLSKDPPKVPDYVVLMREGEQYDGGQVVTGETRVQFSTYLGTLDEIGELLLIEDGEIERSKVRGGDVLTRLGVHFEVHDG